MQKGAGIDEYPSVVPDSAESFPDPGYGQRQRVTQNTTSHPGSFVLISLNYPLRGRAPAELEIVLVPARLQGGIQSDALPRGPRRTTAPPVMRGDDLKLYTRTADDQQIHDLALQVTAEETGYYAKVAAVEKFLKTNYLYSLKPGIRGGR